MIEKGGLTTTIVAVPDRESAAAVAVELVNNGAQLIEICGGLGSTITAKVIEAVGGRVPVGGVTYGGESIHGLARLFPLEPGSE